MAIALRQLVPGGERCISPVKTACRTGGDRGNPSSLLSYELGMNSPRELENGEVPKIPAEEAWAGPEAPTPLFPPRVPGTARGGEAPYMAAEPPLPVPWLALKLNRARESCCNRGGERDSLVLDRRRACSDSMACAATDPRASEAMGCGAADDPRW